ncbi:uncharacterized protein atf5a isoform X1 [Lepisosteus oculatus]|uniref:uncharacterized protein atf5a isoform X1 n=2 Tax=Lepisosteus oculatus TaxID=7918 RepID=UPI00371B1D1E
MMATSAAHWKVSPLGCPADHLALPLPQANASQSQGRRGEESAESQHLIGDGLTDWMTEKVDFSSYLPPSHSSPSPNPSLPPSPPHQHDVQVPSDLEVMTSLLQEELAQLEDYFLSETEPEKMEKADKAPLPAGPQSYYQLPYTAYSSGQPESSPLLVTLATGELDLLSFCGGPIGRPKTPRPAPYSCGHPAGSGGRKRASDSGRVDDRLDNSIWNGKGNNSGTPGVALSYCFIVDDVDNRVVGEEYCHDSTAGARKDSTLLKEEENYCFAEDVTSGVKVVGAYCLGGALENAHKKGGQLFYGSKEGGGRNDGTEAEKLGDGRGSDLLEIVGREAGGEPCFAEVAATGEPYGSFLEAAAQSARDGELGAGGQHEGFAFAGFLGEQALGGEGEEEGGLVGAEPVSPPPRAAWVSAGVRGAQEEDPDVKSEPETATGEPRNGERKQKKRDQNKTAAHRYRQRKRAELDSLEEELRGLEGRNRELRDKAESVEREIQYVKDLLIEVYKARSQRLKQDTSA